MSTITKPLEDLAEAIFWEARLARFALAMKAGFNPGQPRDDHGRWGNGGGATHDDMSANGVTFSAADRLSKQGALDAYNRMFLRPPAELRSRLLANVPNVSPDLSDISVRMRGPDEAAVEMKIRSKSAALIANMTREFRPDGNGDLTVLHAGLEVRNSQQGQGLGKGLLGKAMDEYEAMGLSRVSLIANVDVGGYAWAKYGFVPTDSSWSSISKALSSDLSAGTWSLSQPERDYVGGLLKSSDPKAIWKVADLDTRVAGPHFWSRAQTLGKAMLLGREWHGDLSLKDTEAMARFNRYVGR